MRNARNYKRNPHTASFLLTFHSAMTAAQRMEAATAPEVENEEREALHFVSGGTRAARPVASMIEVTSWSGTTIEVPEGQEFASPAQVKWMMNIAERKELPAGATADALFIRLRQGFARSAASAFITKYKDLPDAPRELTAAEKTAGAEAIAPTATTEEVFGPDKRDAAGVREGRYAVEEDGVLKFFRVTQGKGRWAGRTFLEIQASDDRHSIRNPERREAILKTIAADLVAAGRRYGQELGKCSRCGRTLTDETSRSYGIGPDCRNKF